MSPTPRPELAAGGFTCNDGAVEFYTRVRSLLPEQGTVLDFGAGRGHGSEDPVAYRRLLYDLRGPGRRVVGVDRDPVVLQNPLVDEAHVLDCGRIPLPPASVDLILADHVLEHVDRPEEVAIELARVLRPGGWLCGRTPNRWGYISMGARLVPNSAHARVLARLQPDRRTEDIFPTRYRMNTTAALRGLFPTTHFTHATYGQFVDPLYFGKSRVASPAVRFGTRLLPEAAAPIWCVFIRRDR